MSDDAFTALATIVINAKPVLHDTLHAISLSALEKLTQHKRAFNILAYGQPNAVGDQLQYKRHTLHNNFKQLYEFFHLALGQLLPITYNRSCPSTVTVSSSNTYILQFSRVWLLAIALLPQDIALSHLKHYTFAIELTAFRDVAHNLLHGWFDLNESLQRKLVDTCRPALTKLADTSTHYTRNHFLQLIADAYPALKFACDTLTFYGCSELFPGFVPWQRQNKTAA